MCIGINSHNCTPIPMDSKSWRTYKEICDVQAESCRKRHWKGITVQRHHTEESLLRWAYSEEGLLRLWLMLAGMTPIQHSVQLFYFSLDISQFLWNCFQITGSYPPSHSPALLPLHFPSSCCQTLSKGQEATNPILPSSFNLLSSVLRRMVLHVTSQLMSREFSLYTPSQDPDDDSNQRTRWR